MKLTIAEKKFLRVVRRAELVPGPTFFATLGKSAGITAAQVDKVVFRLMTLGLLELKPALTNIGLAQIKRWA